MGTRAQSIGTFGLIALGVLTGAFVFSGPTPEAGGAWPEGLYPGVQRYAEQRFALTFDDGLMRDATAGVLNALRDRNLRATFFVSGHTIRRTTWHLIRRMVDEGHELANHSYTHDLRMAVRQGTIGDHEAWLVSEIRLTQIRVDLALLSGTTDEFASLNARVFRSFPEIAPRDRQVAEAPGIYARHDALLAERGFAPGAHPVTLRWFRPPGGSPYLSNGWNDAQRRIFAQAMDATDVRIALWSHSTGESIPGLSADHDRLLRRVASAAQAAVTDGGIVLAHDRLSGRPLAVLLDTVARARDRLATLDALYMSRTPTDF